MLRRSAVATILFLLYTSLFFLHRPHLTTLDIGRHLTNGRLLTQNASVLSTNFYSYTNKDVAIVNHHWLFGWLAYQVFRTTGFPGLVIINTLLVVSAIGLIILATKKSTSPLIALIASFASLPLIVDRVNIRPETISLFFVALWLFLLMRATPRTFGKLLIALAITQIIWVNTHLFFVFAWLIAGSFWLRALFVPQYAWQKKKLLLFCISLPLISLLNPAGLAGVLQPFTIFRSYTYPVAENQSLWFFLRYNPKNPIYWYALSLTLVAIVGNALLLYKRKFTQLGLVIINLTLALLSFKITRVGSFFALSLIPILALNLSLVWHKGQLFARQLFDNSLALMLASSLGFGVLILLVASHLFTPKFASFGLRPPKNIDQAVRFLQSIPTSGEIFNNYDIGSYLIYYLFPNKQVFIDNRPEAYPAKFIKNEYIAAQQSETVWRQVAKKYNIGVIFFYYLDATDWASPFIIRRVKDPAWVPVFADNEVVILLANTPKHQKIIEKYRLSPKVFGY